MRAVPRVAASVLTLGVAALVATGCGQSTEDAEAALCADLATLRSSVKALSETSATTTVDEFEQSRENVKDAWKDVQDSARNLSNDRADDLDDAWGDFEDTVNDIDDEDSLASAKADLRAGVAEFEDTKSEIYSGLDCAGTGDDSNG